jgi:ATP-dependent DNA helicase RecG
MRNNPYITQSEMSATLNISVKAVEKHLKNLREKNVIRRVGSDNGGHWEVVQDKQE